MEQEQQRGLAAPSPWTHPASAEQIEFLPLWDDPLLSEDFPLWSESASEEDGEDSEQLVAVVDDFFEEEMTATTASHESTTTTPGSSLGSIEDDDDFFTGTPCWGSVQKSSEDDGFAALLKNVIEEEQDEHPIEELQDELYTREYNFGMTDGSIDCNLQTQRHDDDDDDDDDLVISFFRVREPSYQEAQWRRREGKAAIIAPPRSPVSYEHIEEGTKKGSGNENTNGATEDGALSQSCSCQSMRPGCSCIVDGVSLELVTLVPTTEQMLPDEDDHNDHAERLEGNCHQDYQRTSYNTSSANDVI